ncbi:mucin-binding protein [Lactobacillus hominis]|uniref:MucBP domain protein n=1 Tax=Lactobacillus hominis DSM 23910 = CRBIP 24.179 TaxID=1423758 RepID=I7KGY4_9LACO|nr:LPXTG cell wall anchor domain-containing protein [Lactobacillus hominis]KRM84936.1 mlp [Lactobacillus hominis DSM 23910 = CRBIP 24.179]MCT3348135.1 LPXTG cell wall anchor domain-containing protein [Lactobacillus hominis]CCI81665.1 MucBP domain protein [Lactobacillus hominis DSM 23910 = CRBIP 24.179]
MPKNGGTYRITFVHNIIHVTPDNPGAGYSAKDLEHEVTRTINYVGPDGSIHEPVVQSAKFTASGYYDEVTKHWVSVSDSKVTGQVDGPTWTPENEELAKVVSPSIKGMHVVSVSSDADGSDVASAQVTHQSPNVVITVTYAPNGAIDEGGKTVTGKQIVNFVGPDGKPLVAPNTQTTTFTKSPDVVDPITHEVIKKGSWKETSHTFKNVDSPVIKGYVTRETITKGATVTPDDPDKVITVHYEKVGKIIPVTPDGKPIPNVPNPPYENDPNNPAKVTPNEPVPNIPGYTPSVPTVTPTAPTKDTTVTYTKNDEDQKAVVQYIDQDENNKIIATSGTLTGKVGTTIDYSTTEEIKKLESQGYELVSNGFKEGVKFETNDGKEQVFKVVMKHGYAKITPDQPNIPKPSTPINPDDPNGPKWPDGVSKDDLNKEITRTINYVNGSGTKIAPSVVQSVHFGRTAIVDKVTGKLLGYSTDGKDQVTTTDGDKAWQVIGSNKYKSVDSPSVSGYTDPSPSVVSEKTVVASDKDSIVNVQYTPVSTPIPEPQPEPTPTPTPEPEPTPIPQPHPQPEPTPDEPTPQPEPQPEPDVPAPHGEDEPDNPNNEGDNVVTQAQPQTPILASNNGEISDNTVKPHAQDEQLPQTGQADNDTVLTAGLGLSLVGLLGLIDPKQRKKNN